MGERWVVGSGVGCLGGRGPERSLQAAAGLVLGRPVLRRGLEHLNTEGSVLVPVRMPLAAGARDLTASERARRLAVRTGQAPAGTLGMAEPVVRRMVQAHTAVEGLARGTSSAAGKVVSSLGLGAGSRTELELLAAQVLDWYTRLAGLDKGQALACWVQRKRTGLRGPGPSEVAAA